MRRRRAGSSHPKANENAIVPPTGSQRFAGLRGTRTEELLDELLVGGI